MKMVRKFLTLRNLIIFLLILAIALLLYWRFQLAMKHFFDPDEFGHLFLAYLLSIGELPYRDFGFSYYTPLFITLLSPLLIIFKESVAVIFWARGLNFLIFVSISLLIFLIGRLAFSFETAVLATFFWVFFPTIFIKTVEIRADCLAILFWLISFLLLLLARKAARQKRLIFLAGFCLGLATLTTFKMVFAYLGLMIFFLACKDFTKKRAKYLFIFHLGAVFPGIVLLLSFLALGILKDAWYCIVVLSREVVSAYGKKYFEPAFPFAPNDSLYGLAGKSLPWLTSLVVFFVGVLALLKTAVEIAWRKTNPVSLFLMATFLSFGGSILFFHHHSLVQHYLPLILVICLAAAEFLVFLARFVSKRFKWFWTASGVVCLSVLLLASWQLTRAHLQWTNDREVRLVKNILAISQPEDYFFDMVGYHLFRKSAYWFCCSTFPQWEKFMSRPLPRLGDELKRTQTKFIIETGRLRALTPEDRAFIQKNYSPSGLEGILVAN